MIYVVIAIMALALLWMLQQMQIDTIQNEVLVLRRRVDDLESLVTELEREFDEMDYDLRAIRKQKG